MSQSRQPPGSAAGGQFAASRHGESEIALSGDADVYLNADPAADASRIESLATDLVDAVDSLLVHLNRTSSGVCIVCEMSVPPHANGCDLEAVSLAAHDLRSQLARTSS
jgi:hypothetical protein